MGTDRDRRREWMLPTMIRIPPHHPQSPTHPLLSSFSSLTPPLTGSDIPQVILKVTTREAGECVCMIDTLSNDMSCLSLFGHSVFQDLLS